MTDAYHVVLTAMSYIFPRVAVIYCGILKIVTAQLCIMFDQYKYMLNFTMPLWKKTSNSFVIDTIAIVTVVALGVAMLSQKKKNMSKEKPPPLTEAPSGSKFVRKGLARYHLQENIERILTDDFNHSHVVDQRVIPITNVPSPLLESLRDTFDCQIGVLSDRNIRIIWVVYLDKNIHQFL